MTWRLAGLFACASGWALLSAQTTATPSRVQLSGALGYATFIDESNQSHLLTGGAARFYFTRRNAIEAEVLYLYKDRADKDLVLGANYVRDLGSARGNAVPYFVGGVGYVWGIRPRFTETSPTISAGFGVRYFPRGGRMFVSPEVRLGSEPILRLQVNVGWATAR
ncbi:MAG: hypothetical protein IT162_09375 [Bryobacterales bacterium]|nr:hypothetical protein [Bryobacterales bacterium]